MTPPCRWSGTATTTRLPGGSLAITSLNRSGCIASGGLVERRKRLEALARKGLGEARRFGQRPQGAEFSAQILIGPTTPCRCKWYSDGRIWSWVIIPPPDDNVTFSRNLRV